MKGTQGSFSLKVFGIIKVRFWCEHDFNWCIAGPACTQHTKPSCCLFSFPLTNSFLMTDTVATSLLCLSRYKSLASTSGAVPVQTELHVLPVINNDSFSKRRRAWRMGWSTAFNSKAFWLIYAFFPSYFSIRGVSHAHMHVHSIA